MKTKYLLDYKALYLLICLILNLACSRNLDKQNFAKLVLKMPAKNSSAKVGTLTSFPTTGHLCWGANVTGDGIVTSSGLSCGPALGSFAGFVQDGAPLELLVPRGSARSISVFAYHAEAGEACPSWSHQIQQFSKIYGKSYKVGEVTGVDLNELEVSVDVNVSFPGEESNVLAQLGASASTCSGGANNPTEAVLSNGQILRLDNTALEGSDPSLANVRSAFVIGTQRGVYTNASQIILPNIILNVPPPVSSVTYKADNHKFYGLRHDGIIVELDLTNTTLIELTPPLACPFASCQVPVWFQSVSAGNGTDLFGLDHAGNLYRVVAGGGVTQLPQTVPTHVTHFY